jgi:UDP-N-acetylglucosamine:LPS N-acetylglucosamine transferase
MSADIMIDSFLSTAQNRTVLILTAAVGAGHTSMGYAIREECDRNGSQAVLLDGVEAVSPLMLKILAGAYSSLLHFAPILYGVGFAVITRRYISPVVQFCMGLLLKRRLAKIVGSIGPDIIVSTYPFITSTLGILRRKGDVQAPVVAVIGDFGAHPLWVSADIDLHLVACPISAQMVEDAGGRAQVAQLPVAPSFQSGLDRAEARAKLDLPKDAFIVLIVGGSLGLGDLVRTAECVVEAGAFALIVTGKHERLYETLNKKLGASPNARIVKWTSEMPFFMEASDCMVQSTQGMTIVEAMAAGLPIVTFGPLPGHGALNAQVMEEAGIAPWVRSADELKALLQAAVEGKVVLPSPTLAQSTPSVTSVLSSLHQGATGLSITPALDTP